MARTLSNIHSLEQNYNYSASRLSSQKEKGTNEAAHLQVYLRKFIAHLGKIHKGNPDLSENEIKTILLKELDDYSQIVFENSYVFDRYLDYYASVYLSSHADKYKELSEKLRNSSTDYSNLQYSDCNQFDEYLTLYIYRLKESLCEFFFEGLEDRFPVTPENIKKFDSIIEENKEFLANSFFTEDFGLPEVAQIICSDNSMASKHAMIKKLESCLPSPADKRDLEKYANIFLHGSYTYVSNDQPRLVKELRSELAHSTSQIVNSLDSLGHLENYISDYAFEMSRLRCPELARAVCVNGFPDQKFLEELYNTSNQLQIADSKYNLAKRFSPQNEEEALLSLKSERAKLHTLKRSFYDNVDKSKLKAALDESYLNSSTSISLEGLLALNSFWANRYAKELDTYSEAIYVSHKFDFVNKILNNEKIDVSLTDLDNALVQMNTFYQPASNFLAEMQQKILSHPEELDLIDEGKFMRFSYDPFVNSCVQNFGSENYKAKFDQVFPGVKHDLKEDANLYVRAYNPIFSSYTMKNEMINALLLSMDSPDIPNSGIILLDYNGDSLESKDGTSAYIPYFPIIGMDAGLSFPVRIHAKKTMLIDFLKSINGNAIMPIYEGAEDFNNPFRNTGTISASLITPVTEKVKVAFKNGIKVSSVEGTPNYHPHADFISHLAFVSQKKVPEHLQSVVSTSAKGKVKYGFVRRYIDLENGDIFNKVNDAFVPVSPKDVKDLNKGELSYDE